MALDPQADQACLQVEVLQDHQGAVQEAQEPVQEVVEVEAQKAEALEAEAPRRNKV